MAHRTSVDHSTRRPELVAAHRQRSFAMARTPGAVAWLVLLALLLLACVTALSGVAVAEGDAQGDAGGGGEGVVSGWGEGVAPIASLEADDRFGHDYGLLLEDPVAGFSELAVAAPRSSMNAPRAGRVYVVRAPLSTTPPDGGFLWAQDLARLTLAAGEPDASFGSVVLGVDALGSQAWRSLVVTAPGALGRQLPMSVPAHEPIPLWTGDSGAPEADENTRRGRVYIFATNDGRLLRTLAGRPGDYFGVGAALVDDADSDGAADLSISSFFLDAARNVRMRREVYSSTTGALMIGQKNVDAPIVRLAADLNGDGVVDALDLGILIARLGDADETAGWRADINADGFVDAADMALLLDTYGEEADEPEMASSTDVICGSVELGGHDSGACNVHTGPGGTSTGGGSGGGEGGGESPGGGGGDGTDGGGDGGGGGGGGDDDPPCVAVVSITGAPDKYIAMPPDGSPVEINLVALGSPAGGTYKWSSSPTVTFVSGASTSQAVTMQIHSPGPVWVNVTYTVSDHCSVTASEAFRAVRIRLHIDADNNNGFGLPDGSAEEEEVKHGAGMKVLIVNRGDSNENGIPDYADGFGLFGPESASGTAGNQFVPIRLRLEGFPNDESSEALSVSFTYNAADPASTTRETVPVPDIQSSFDRYERGDGLLRIWTNDGVAPRTLEDFIGSGDSVGVNDLAPETILYVEAVNGSPYGVPITAVVQGADGGIAFDWVRALPFDAETGLLESEITGFTILHGSVDAGDGNHIIFGTPGDDVISVGNGENIIVLSEGENVVYLGDGENTIFTSWGYDEIIAQDAAALVRSGHPRLIRRNGHANTAGSAMLSYFSMYGDINPWMSFFLSGQEFNGRVFSISFDGAGDGKASWEILTNIPGAGDVYVIKVEFDTHRPHMAAALIRRELLNLASTRTGPRLHFEGYFQDEIVLDRGMSQEPPTIYATYDAIQNYQTLRALSFENAAATVSMLAEAYAAGLGILNVGLDVVITVNELADGNYVAAVGLLPFVPATITRHGDVLLRWAGNSTFRKVTVPRRKQSIAVGLDSKIGYVMHAKMPWEEIPAIDGSVTLRLGTAQEVLMKYGNTSHRDTVLRISHDLARTGQYEYITMNRKWFTAVDQGGEYPTTTLATQPDIIGVRRTGTVDAIEVRSTGQNADTLLNRLQQEMATLPGSIQGNTLVFELDSP